MESSVSFCTMILLYFMASSETTHLITEKCIQTAVGCDCSGLALQFVPDEVPDSVKTLEFSFNYLPALYNSTFQKLKSLVLLDLTRCSINFMYEDIFQHQPNLESLILVGNPLLFIAESAFSGPHALKHLSLAQSKIRSLTDIPAANLMFLETLELTGSDISSLDGLSNFNLQQMKRLLLGLNSIEKISVADVVGFQKASGTELSFKGNNLVDVEPNAFQGLDIGSLDFSGCFNKMNTSVLLKGLEGMKTNKLNLGVYEDSTKGFITSTGLQSFCYISVVDLDFQLQHLHDITATSFQCLKGLKKLDFTRAHLSSFPSNLSNLSTLSYLVLDENTFRDICNIHAANFPMLTHLSISGNLKPLLFKESCLQPLSHLNELDLSHNKLITGEFCCNKQLSGLYELKLLNLSYNYIRELLPFTTTPQLQNLDCSHMNYSLKSLSPFRNLQNLQTLNLSWSGSDLSNVQLFKGLKNLLVLNLKGNTIKGGILAKAETFNYVPLLESLDLSECGFTDIKENVFKGLTKLINVDLSKNHLIILSFSAFYSLKQIQLNFARNVVVKVDVKSVEDLGEISTIDLSYNPLVCNCTNYQFINWAKGNANKMKHLQETVCSTLNQTIIYVDLQCKNSYGLLLILLTVAIILSIIISILCFVRKFKSVSYSRL
ncbi:CD180 antigen [Pygocentrus nattereri]|uniref:CD180 molecule n=1 Tax=Pygocentrus nattereri TaxID=42514 RepID=A0A3B4DDE8_PYGNA|nr:CD180 antigen [Pygocentrus nattereri]